MAVARVKNPDSYQAVNQPNVSTVVATPCAILSAAATR